MRRLIAHIDMDAFYASVELLRYPELRGRAVVIGGGRDSQPIQRADGSREFATLRDYAGRGVITTSTYEARALGVHSAMGVMKAALLAPDIVVQIDAETDPRECECKPISECGAILFGEPEEEGPDHLRWYERLHFCDRFDRAFRDCETETKGWTPVCPGENTLDDIRHAERNDRDQSVKVVS